MSRVPRRFELHVVPDDDGGYGLDIVMAVNSASATTVAHLHGLPLDRIRASVVGATTASKHARTVLSPTRKTPIQLTEDAGVRLALSAIATAPLSKPARIEAIRLGVDAMSSEEALYWFAHATGPNSGRALKALRILLAHE